MDYSEIISLFRKANKKHQWGENTELRILDDGSGAILPDGELLLDDWTFVFNNENELIEKLKQ